MAKNTEQPVSINVNTGDGVPGGFSGMSQRITSNQASEEIKKILNSINFSDDNLAILNIKKLSQEDGQKLAKAAGEADRRAKGVYIYSGNDPIPDEIVRWDKKIQTISSSGFIEKDSLKPTNITEEDWKVAVKDYMAFSFNKDKIDQDNLKILRSKMNVNSQTLPIRYTYFTLNK